MDNIEEGVASNQKYYMVADAINSVVDSKFETLSPTALAEQLIISGLKLTRLFNLWAGISPSRFIRFVSCLQAAKGLKGET